MKRVMILAAALIFCLSLSVCAEERCIASDLPPLPYNSRSHFAVYTENSRGGRIELSMFDIAPGDYEDSGLIVCSNGTIGLAAEELYKNDIKYYLDGNNWVEFESGYKKISDNSGELLYSDLNYLYVGDRPDDNTDCWSVNPSDDGGYYVGTYSSNPSEVGEFINFYHTKDFREYTHITTVPMTKPVSGFYNMYGSAFLARLNGEYVVVVNSRSYAPNSYKSVGGVYRNGEVYSISDYDSPLFSFAGSNISYDYDAGQFVLEKETVIEDGVSGARGVPAVTELTYRTTADFTEFKDLDEIAYPNSIEDYSTCLLEKDGYSVNALVQPNMYMLENGEYEKNVYSLDGETLIENYIVFDDGTQYKYLPNKEQYVDSETSDGGMMFMSKRNGGILYSADGVYFKSFPIDDKDVDLSTVRCSGGFVSAYSKDRFYKLSVSENGNPPLVAFDGYILSFPERPVVESGRTLVSMRLLLEQMGAAVVWDEPFKTVTATLGNTAVSMRIDSPSAVVSKNGMSYEKMLDVPARLINGTTMIPIRFLSETFNFSVSWDEDKNLVTVTKIN